MQGHLQNTVRGCVPNLAVCGNADDGGVIRPARANRELAQAARRIRNPVRVLWAKALIDVVVPIQDHVRAVLI